jgi:hypothetical protein
MITVWISGLRVRREGHGSSLAFSRSMAKLNAVYEEEFTAPPEHARVSRGEA